MYHKTAYTLFCDFLYFYNVRKPIVAYYEINKFYHRILLLSKKKKKINQVLIELPTMENGKVLLKSS